MLASLLQSLYRYIISQNLTEPLSLTLGLLFLYLLWHQWSFHVSPWLYPKQVNEVPYRIPFLGHTLSMFKNTDTLIGQGMVYFSRSYQPFSIRLLGERLYVVSSPADVAAIYKNPSVFSWDAYMDRLLHGFGLSAQARKLAWSKPLCGTQKRAWMAAINPQNKDLVHLIEDIYIMQLLPGERLDVMMDNVVSRLDSYLTWPKLRGPYVLEDTSTSRQISIKNLCACLITDATTRAMFGDLIFEYEPNLIHHLSIFNDYSWACVFNLPKVLTPKFNQAKYVLSSAIRRYLRTPKRFRPQEAWSVGAIIEAAECFGMDEDSQVAMLLMVWWAAHSNTINTCFWLLCYVLYNPTLMNSLRTETKFVMRDDTINIQGMMNQCPLLDSTYLEVLRLVNGAFSIRRVEKDIDISGKTLRAGNSVVVPFRELHYNQNVWGPLAIGFDPERFLKHRKLANHPSYRPFGGGVSYCPGRYLAKSEVCGFLVALINRFEIELPKNHDGTAQPFPPIDCTKPVTGVSGCMPNSDPKIELRPRHRHSWTSLPSM